MYTHYDLMLPLMKLMQREKKVLSLQEAYQALIKELDCTPEDIAHRMDDRRNTILYRLQWSKTYLKNAGLLEYPKRAHFQLTQAGKKVDLKNVAQIDKSFLSKFEGFNDFKNISTKSNQLNFESSIDSVKEDLTPPEAIEFYSNELNNQIKQELLDLVKANNPAFFERLVVDLLVAMGYGGSHQDAAQAIGKTNDGGIDGIISEDRLGLDKIYIQAKRWQGTIGRPDIQQFKGALADQVAKKGVFITTSSFSKEAIESAKKSGIVLIDGDRLTSLMIEFGLGVTIERSFHVYRIDSDRFEENI